MHRKVVIEINESTITPEMGLYLENCLRNLVKNTIQSIKSIEKNNKGQIMCAMRRLFKDD